MLLSPRQAQVLDLVLQGRTNSVISRQLGITLGTVKAHCRVLFLKYGVQQKGGHSHDLSRIRLAIKTDQGAVGDGTTCPAGNTTGLSQLANVTATSVTSATYSTSTNCAAVGSAANPSIATCGSAASGAFSCDPAATGGTCRVNTTAVTANSRIFVQQSDAEGANLGVTCNTAITISATSPLLASKSAGANFLINLGTVTANPGCFVFWIVN